ncbi:carotenoid cleavage dioxygenase [Dunaliella salina]|uniref:carotenoid 9,10-dioxygenase n=1 Tax=Dunaliella salina TaxID=3046 RepID=A0ABQ7GRC9_DUNSA|nr:carotenoid cleavage dioxygenase [Dunaliella salina]|eukprot:KAF5837122.1 carotenoid cleavage dioxygenase [Dunaliella salina]
MMMKAAHSVLSTHSRPVTPVDGLFRQRQHKSSDRVLARVAEMPLTSIPTRTPKPLDQAEIPRSPFEDIQEALARSTPRKRNVVLEGNYGPVRNEMFVPGLQIVEGALPREMNGVYIRNGPDPLYDPISAHHWFEGDGMVHAVRIKDGSANYCNSYVDTFKIDLERRAGRPIWAKFADQEGMLGLGITMLELLKIQTGVLDMSHGNGTANTNLVHHAGKLMALHEGDLPYQLYVSPEGVVRTVKRMDLGEAWRQPTDNFTAHPKLDSKTGSLHFFSYHVMTPQIKLGALDPQGRLSYSLKVDLPQPAMIHDMAITKSSKIIFHFPLSFDPAAMITQNSLPLVFRDNLTSRIGLVPHNATSQNFMSFHVVNAWEDGPDGRYVTIYLLAMKRIDMDASEFRDEYASKMHKITLDRKTGSAHMRKVTSIVGDFPVTNPQMQGQKTRFAWTNISATSGNRAGQTIGVAKFDLSRDVHSDACCAEIHFPAGHCGGEAVMVPRNANDPSAQLDGEDDGFLVCYVHHETQNTSYMMVYDAKTMSNTPVAKVKMPQRVPYGFHGTFLNDSQLMGLQAA